MMVVVNYLYSKDGGIIKSLTEWTTLYKLVEQQSKLYKMLWQEDDGIEKQSKR